MDSIDHKGFAYCTEHGKERQAYCRTRRMRPWEVKLIATGTPLPSYKPISQTEGMNRLRKLGYAV
jgi:hypothetical protein